MGSKRSVCVAVVGVGGGLEFRTVGCLEIEILEASAHLINDG